DNSTMGRWLGVKVDLVKSPPDKGVGTVRRLHIGLQKIDEEIVEREVPKRIAYKIVRGLFPLSYHRGEVNVTSLGADRSSAEWRIDLESKIPALGALVRVGLGAGIDRALKKLDRQLGRWGARPGRRQGGGPALRQTRSPRAGLSAAHARRRDGPQRGRGRKAERKRGSERSWSRLRALCA